jgi:hypothetical protein
LWCIWNSFARAATRKDLEQRRRGSDGYYYAVHVSCGEGRGGEEVLSGAQGIHRGRVLQQAQLFRACLSGLADRDSLEAADLEWLLEEVKKRIAGRL